VAGATEQVMEKNKVLFLCTGNSCRSQIAEGLVNAILGDTWEAVSAGTEPAGYVHPLAIRVMEDLDIDISGHESKSAEEFRDVDLDLVITVCDGAAENCPLWLGSGRVVHISFPDPARATGTEDERLAIFRRARNDIRRQILGFLISDSAEKS
jgi:arsenate reductase